MTQAIGEGITKAQVLDAVQASIARGSSTPTLPIGADRDAYLARVGRDLEDAMIDPVRAVVHGVDHEYGLLDLLARTPCYVVARKGQHYLGFVPATGDFFLAWGPEPGNLDALGFFSDDALAEWLG